MYFTGETRIRTRSVPNFSYKHFHVTLKRSKSEINLFNKRKVFNGRITASVIIISEIDGLFDVCKNYNESDKSMLFDDRPYKICGLSLDQVKQFPAAKSQIVTPEMRKQALDYSKNYRIGRDFVFEDALKKNRFGKIPINLGFLCEVVLPSGDKRYPNIDLTTVTEKTEDSDKDIIYTAKRGLLEEIGLDVFSNKGKEIFHPRYQEEFRKKYYPSLPYNFSIGTYGKATECIVVGANPEDLISCQIFQTEDPEERQYQNYERMIEKLLENAF